MADRIRIGNAEIFAVMDMVPPPRQPTAFIPDVPADAWEPYADEVLEDGMLQLYYGCFFIRSRGKTVLVDTGMGPGPHPHLENRTGDLMGELARLGVGPSDVDVVLHTHLHPDHVGWNVDDSGGSPRPYFPAAKYLAPRKDWEHFTAPDVLTSAPHVTRSVMPLVEQGLMELVDGEHHVTDEITTLETPGHTPGHLVILISSGGERGAIIGDLIHNPVQIHEPDWCAGVDVDKAASRRSRKSFLAMAERQGLVVAAGHFRPERHIGRVVRLQGRRHWQSL
jgi:glyoxylase-like metal-dependent hydrolase (beta-lactamase superfamily II)